MDVRLFDLDGSVADQPLVCQRATRLVDLRPWGPRLRMACGWDAFRRFEIDLSRRLGATRDLPAVTFLGSGDFHHLSLALVRRISRPVNLLLIDNHPDWMRGVPLLHCGTWLYHAARSPLVRRVFHVGGEIDFDNHYRWLAPWGMLQPGKIVVLPSVRCFTGGGWAKVPHKPLRESPGEEMTVRRLDDLLRPWRDELASAPLYVSLDRDVIRETESVSNWDHGRLTSREVLKVLRAFRAMSRGLAGMDVVGDWSEVRTEGLLRAVLHWTEHPTQRTDPRRARCVNEPINLAVLEELGRAA